MHGHLGSFFYMPAGAGGIDYARRRALLRYAGIASYFGDFWHDDGTDAEGARDYLSRGFTRARLNAAWRMRALRVLWLC